MTEGIFDLSFFSDNENIGNGFASFKNGKIRGGNEEFSYYGTYDLGQQSKDYAVAFDAKISVQYYKGINLAILGKIAQFPVEMSGADGFKIDDLPLTDQSHACWMFLSCTSELMEDADKLQLTAAFDAYQCGQYVKATSIAYAVVNKIIDRLFYEAHENNIEVNNLTSKINILIDINVLPRILRPPLVALASSSKKSKSPEDCAFPLCIMAFNSLDKLVEIVA
jgi:hypothetical protein